MQVSGGLGLGRGSQDVPGSGLEVSEETPATAQPAQLAAAPPIPGLEAAWTSFSGQGQSDRYRHLRPPWEGDRKALTEAEQPRVSALLPQACALPDCEMGGRKSARLSVSWGSSDTPARQTGCHNRPQPKKVARGTGT